MNMQLYKRFCQEEFNEHGTLTRFSIHHPDNFNFAYDVMDVLAAEEPDSEALVWCNVAGEERRFTYGELGELSNRTANALARAGGDKGRPGELMLTGTTNIGPPSWPCTSWGPWPCRHPHAHRQRHRLPGAGGLHQSGGLHPGGGAGDYVAEARKVCPTLTIPCIVRQPKEGFLFLDEAVSGRLPRP